MAETTKGNPSDVQRISSSRMFMPLLGNAVILIVIGWLGPYQLRLPQLLLAGAICLLLYNGLFFLRSRLAGFGRRKE